MRDIGYVERASVDPDFVPVRDELAALFECLRKSAERRAEGHLAALQEIAAAWRLPRRAAAPTQDARDADACGTLLGACRAWRRAAGRHLEATRAVWSRVRDDLQAKKQSADAARAD